MAYFSTEDAQDAINVLKQYLSTASEDIEKMFRAGRDCEDNMANDEAAKKANASLVGYVNAIQKNLELINSIIQGLQRELEHYQEVNQASNSL